MEVVKQAANKGLHAALFDQIEQFRAVTAASAQQAQQQMQQMQQQFTRMMAQQRPLAGQLQPRQQAPPPPAANPNDELKAMMRLMLANQQKVSSDISTINGRLEAVTTHLKMLDTQVAQNAEAVKRQQGTLPAKGEQNPRKECHAISVMEEDYFAEFEAIFEPVNSTPVNSTPVNSATVNSTPVNSAPNGTVKKLGDPGRFELLVQIDSTVFHRSLCDTGSSVNIMPYSTAKRLGFDDFSKPSFSLKFADCFVKRPLGVLEDIQLLIGGVYVPADFVVLDQPEDPGDPLILGRPFLCTAGARIDLKHGRIDLQLGDTELKFEMGKQLEIPPDPPDAADRNFHPIGIGTSSITEGAEIPPDPPDPP